MDSSSLEECCSLKCKQTGSIAVAVFGNMCLSRKTLGVADPLFSKCLTKKGSHSWGWWEVGVGELIKGPASEGFEDQLKNSDSMGKLLTISSRNCF